METIYLHVSYKQHSTAQSSLLLIDWKYFC